MHIRIKFTIMMQMFLHQCDIILGALGGLVLVVRHFEGEHFFTESTAVKQHAEKGVVHLNVMCCLLLKKLVQP